MLSEAILLEDLGFPQEGYIKGAGLTLHLAMLVSWLRCDYMPEQALLPRGIYLTRTQHMQVLCP